jgi:hypothetical protein
MNVATIAGALILSVVTLLFGCERWRSDAEAKISLTAASGVAVPDVDQLARKLDSGLRFPRPGTKVYTRDGGKLVEVKPAPVGKYFSAVVRSFDAKQGMAYVELTSREYKMPVIQIWRFDGKTWSDSVDPGIFVR